MRPSVLTGARAVVTGGAGFIGSNLVEHLAPQNEVVVFDRTPQRSAANASPIGKDVEYIEGDVRKPLDLERAVKGAHIVFHLAALASVPDSFRDPVSVNETNVHGTLHVLRAAKAAGVRRVVFASSSAVYGAGHPPLREDAPLDLLSPYAVSKAAGELWCRHYNEIGIETVALRLFNVYGPRQRADGAYAAVIPSFLRAIAHGDAVSVFGDGEQTRDFVYVSDVAEAFSTAATANAVAGEVVNVGSGEPITIHGLLAVMGDVLGKEARVEVRDPRPGDIRHSFADAAKARQLLGFRPRVGLTQGLLATSESLRDGG